MKNKLQLFISGACTYYKLKYIAMPGALIDRPKMTKTMYQALKRHIMKERERKKQGIVCLQMERWWHCRQCFINHNKAKKNYSYKNNLINKHPASVSCQAFLMSMHGTFLYVSVYWGYILPNKSVHVKLLYIFMSNDQIYIWHSWSCKLSAPNGEKAMYLKDLLLNTVNSLFYA